MNGHRKPSQKRRVLRLLHEAGTRGVRTSEFLAAHLPRFGARIFELREEGHLIEKRGDPQSESGAIYTLTGRREIGSLPRTVRKKPATPSVDERLLALARKRGDGARAIVIVRTDPAAAQTRVTIQLAPEAAYPAPSDLWIGETLEDALESAERSLR